MASLYAHGWRQGSLVYAELPVGGLATGEDGQLTPRVGSHPAWVLVTQDCDLAFWETTLTEPLVELRARHPVPDPSAEWGIRSRILRLNETECVLGDEPPIHLPPAALVTLTDGMLQPGVLSSDRTFALKTWLGYRYDRPAVPVHLVDLARDIAKRAQRPSQRHLTAELHDVLMQFDDQSAPPQFVLFAVVRDGADKDGARRWLAEVGAAVPRHLGVLAGLDAGYRSETSLELLETSYAADLTRLSWPGPKPTGAL